MKKVLITGGAGFIGSNLARRLKVEGLAEKIYVADNLWRGRKENLVLNGESLIDLDKDFHEVDLTDLDACRLVTKDVDTVFHLADIVAGINFVFDNQHFLFRQNILINTNVLAACIENKVENYIYVGTACSYPKDKQANLDPPPFKEHEVYPAEPESSYGWSKLMGEYEAELAMKSGNINVGILRFHNVYGGPCELSPEKSQVIPALCRKAIEYPDTDFIVWGSGTQRRAFVYIDDIIDGLVQVVRNGMGKGAIQLGPSESVSIKDIAEKIVRISGKNINIQFDTTKAEGDKDRTADFSRARELLGWEPKVSIDQGLQATFDWCRQHLAKKRRP